VDKKAIIQRALDNINHPLSEITRRTTYRARSPGVAPVSGIKMALPKTSTMAKKMQKVLDDETPAGRKKQKQMANLVIGREEDDKEILLQFKTAASREKFRKLMNEDVQIDEEKSLFDISPTSSKWMKGRLRTGYNKSQKSGMPKEMFKKGQVIDLHPFDGDRFVGAKSPKDKGSYFFVAKRHVDAMKEDVQVDEAMAPFNPMGSGKRKPATKIGRDTRNQLEMTKPSEYSFSAPAADGGTFAVIPIKTSRPSSQAGVMMAIFDKRGKVSAYYGTHMDTDSAKKFAKKDGLIEDVQLGEEVIKARVAFFGRPNQNNSDMRDAKKKNMFVDAKDVSAAKGKMFDVTFNSRRQFNRFESEYDFLMVKVFEDINESILGKLDKVLDKVERKLDRLARAYNNLPRNKAKLDRENKERAERVLKNFDNMVAELDRIYAHVDEDVQLDETMIARDLESMIKGLKRGAKQEIADALNDMNLSGYGDYEARVDNVHKFKPKDLFNAMKKVMKLESLKMSLDERAMTYVIDRRSKEIVYGPTDTGDAKLYLKKQIQPRKLMIRQIRGAAKKVGDTV